MEAPLNERLRLFSDALKDADPRYASAYDSLVNRLETARSGNSAPGVGDVMPSFALPDGDGRMHGLDEYLAKGPWSLVSTAVIGARIAWSNSTP